MNRKVVLYFNYLSYKLRTVKIRTRLIIGFILLSIIPLSSVALISYFNYHKTIQNNTLTYSAQHVEQLKQHIDYILDKYLNKANEISTDLETIKYVKNYEKMDNLSKQLAFTETYTKLQDSTRIMKELISIEVLDGGEMIINTQYRITHPELDKSDIFTKSMASPNRINWFSTRKLEYRGSSADAFNNNAMAIILSVKIKSHTTGDTIGLLNMALTENSLYSAFKDTNLKTKGYIYIADDDGNIISHHDKSLLSTKDSSKITDKISKIQQAQESNNPYEKYFVQKINGHKSLVSFSISEITGWRIIYVIDYSILMSDANRLSFITILIIILCILFILPISFIVTNSVTTPIYGIINSMDSIEKENFMVEVNDRSPDEIGYLARTFNQMVIRIRRLITEVYDVKIKQKEAQFIALQSQINPHFLYNTLDSINWMAFISQNKEISIMVQSLSDFFRLSLNKGNEFYTIKQEINHVKSYITIQQIRYHNKIKFHFDLCQDILDYATIKLLLQPLVENAIFHGIEPNGGEGNIKIIIKKMDHLIQMEVLDDGVGITNIEKAYSEPHDTTGYGVKNINERIKLYFGSEYGLELENLPTGGTVSRICIPAIIWKGDSKIDENTISG